MNQQQKAKALRLKTSKKALELKKARATGEQNKLIVELIGSAKVLSEQLNEGVEINNLDELVLQLADITALNGIVAGLKQAVDKLNLPKIPKSVEVVGLDQLIGHLKKDKSVKLSHEDRVILSSVTRSIDRLKAYIIANAVESEPTSQLAKDFIPVRRVIQVNKRFLFDDAPQSRGSGGGVIIGSGGSGTSTIMQILIDNYTTTNATYIGRAAPGTPTSQPNWQICIYDKRGNYPKLQWAAEGAYTQIFDNRVGLTYS